MSKCAYCLIYHFAKKFRQSKGNSTLLSYNAIKLSRFSYSFQRLLLSITPEKEQKDIIEGKPGARATLDHWISL